MSRQLLVFRRKTDMLLYLTHKIFGDIGGFPIEQFTSRDVILEVYISVHLII